MAKEQAVTSEVSSTLPVTMAQLQAQLQDRDQRLLEYEQSLSLLLSYIEDQERVLGAQVAATTERDWKINDLQRRLALGRWSRIASGATSLLRAVTLRLYQALVPASARLQLWQRRHPYGPAARLAPLTKEDTRPDRMADGPARATERTELSVAIVTRNAIHGGVETMIALHQQRFNATVLVAGGQNRPDTCPFHYTYIDATNEVGARQRLASSLLKFDVVVYHWIPGWAQAAIRDAGIPCIEVVHREDTSDNDKTIPTLIVTHSDYLAAYLRAHYAVEARVIPHGVDTKRFQPADLRSGSESGNHPYSAYIGAITSYHPLKGVDLFLSAWATVQHQYPQYQVRFYGSGPELESLRRQARTLGLDSIEILGPLSHPEAHMAEFGLFVVPFRAEGMPFTVLEALSSNIPVLASDLDAMREFNQIAVERGSPAPLILFERESLSDLAEKLDGCLGNLTSGRVDTRTYISRYFSIDEHCQQYRSAMEQAVVLHAKALPEFSRRD